MDLTNNNNRDWAASNRGIVLVLGTCKYCLNGRKNKVGTRSPPRKSHIVFLDIRTHVHIHVFILYIFLVFRPIAYVRTRTCVRTYLRTHFIKPNS